MSFIPAPLSMRRELRFEDVSYRYGDAAPAFAYTLDGSGLGELEIETFSAKSIRVTIRGLSVHPGTAKGKLVNSVKLAADFLASLPSNGLSPETVITRKG